MVSPQIRILIVDDEPEVCALSKDFLEQAKDFQADSVCSARAAREALQQWHYDAIVSDYQMPREDGIQFLKSLRNGGNSIPFILLTGKGREEVVIKALNHGADSYVQKGGAPEPLYTELEHRIRAAVRRHRAEKALVESEAFHRQLMVNISCGVVIIDPRTRTIENVNEAAASLFGAPKEAMIGRRCHSFLCTAPEGECPVCDLRLEFENTERVLLTAKGEERPVLKTVRKIDVRGQEKLLECFIDIAQRKRADEERARTLSILRSTMESTADGILVVDGDGAIIFSNAIFKEMCGIPESIITAADDEAALRYALDLLKDPDAFFAKVQDLYQQAEAVSFDILELKDGRVFERYSQPLFNKDAITGRVWSFRDVTERGRLQEEIASREEKFREIFNHANDAIRVHEVGADGTPGPFLDVNDVACRMLGYTREEMLCRRPSDISSGRFDPPLPRILESLRKEGWAKFETEHVHKDGTLVPVEVNAHIVNLQGRRLTVAVVRDVSERKRADEALRQSKRLFENLVSRISAGIYIMRAAPDHVLSLDYASPRFAEILCLEVERMMQDLTYIFRSVHPDDLPGLLALNASRVRQGLSFEWEGRVLSDGELRWVQIESVPEQLEDGHTLWHGILLDITERKLVEEKLRESEQKFMTTIAESSDGILLIDSEGRIVECNSALTRIFGYSREEMIGGLAWELQYSTLPEERRARTTPEKMREEALNYLSAPDFSVAPNAGYEVLNRQGHRKFVQVTMFPIATQGKRLFCSIIRDVTEQRQAEAALRESEQKYRFIANNMAEMVSVMDMDLRVTYASPSVVNLLGYTVEESLGQDVEVILTPESLRQVQQAFEESFAMAMASKGSIPQIVIELEEIRKDGARIWVSNSLTFVNDDSGEPVAILSVSRDITERKMADNALREANRKLNLLSSITRHDINNQMLILGGQLALMEKAHPEVANDERLRKTEEAAQRISAMIQFTKAYEDIGVHAPGWHRVRPLLREASVSIQMSGVELTDEVPEAVEIFADPLIVKVFHNLVDNAVRHAEGVTQVRFSIADLQGGPLIICEDDGRGIGPEMREHLFERGFGKNHGLGLFLCREILSITGIRIEEEGAAGEGARFVMTPPAQGIRVRRNDVA